MKYRLEDICSFRKEKVAVSSLTLKNYISTENMLPNKAGITKATSLPKCNTTQRFECGDVLVSNIRPYFKKIWKAKFNGGCSNDVLVFSSKEGFDTEFLYYVLSDDSFFEYSMATSKGTKMPRGDKKSIMNYEVPGFDMNIQIKIASILKSIDDKIELNNKINNNLEQQYISMVDHLLSKLTQYKIYSLSEVADCQNGRAFYKEGYDPNGAFVIDLGNVNTFGNFVRTATDKYISLDRYKEPKLEKYRVYKNDIVMVMTDRKSTMELLGKVGKIYKDGYYLLNQRMYRIRAKKGINTNYLYACLNSTETSNFLKRKALGSVQKYVNTGEINSIEIKVPSSEKMEEIASILDPIFSQMELNILENESLTELRDILLPKLMSGELDVSDIDL